MRILIRSVIIVVCFLVGATAVIASAHTPSGRQTWLGKHVMTALISACPVQKVSAAQVDATVESGMKNQRGKTLAPERPALGFTLDQTTLEEAKTRLSSLQQNCTIKKLGYEILDCFDSEKNETTLAFNGAGKLKSISVYRKNLAPDLAKNLWEKTAKSLQEDLGTPMNRIGDAHLTANNETLDLHSYEYRFRDYYARVTILNKGKGKVLYERYQSAL